MTYYGYLLNRVTYRVTFDSNNGTSESLILSGKEEISDV